MSIIGLMAYDPTVLDTFHVPKSINFDHLKLMLYAECADREVLYPNPRLFKQILEAWSATMLPVWEELVNTTVYDYNPIHNYDRYEEWEETGTETGSETGTNSVQRSENGSTTRKGDSEHGSKGKESSSGTVTGSENTTSTGSKTFTNSITGFNGGVMVPHDSGTESTNATQNVGNSSSDNTSGESSLDEDSSFNESGTNNSSGSETGNSSKQTTGNNTLKHKAHLYGNIGVTTNQQMLEAQRDLVQFRVEHVIVRDFKDYFTIGVYLF